MKKPKRIFAFGDSFTRYFWACWPEVLALELDAPLYNFGFPAAGNHLTFNALVQANQYYKFNEDDLVIVSWTIPSRKDVYKDGVWLRFCELVKSDKRVFDNHLLPSEVEVLEYDEVGYLLRDLAFITTAQTLLDSTGAEWYNFKLMDFFSLSLYHESERLEGGEADKLKMMFADPLSKIEDSFIDVLYDGSLSNLLDENIEWHPRYMDCHPLPTAHLKYLEKVLGMQISSRTKSIIEEHERQIVESIKLKLKNQPTNKGLKIAAWHLLDFSLIDVIEFNRQEIDWSKFFLSVQY